MDTFIGGFAGRAGADGVAINGCYLGLCYSDGGYFRTYCGTPDTMAQQALDDIRSLPDPDNLTLSLASCGFLNGYDHSGFAVNFTICDPTGFCRGSGNDYGLRC